MLAIMPLHADRQAGGEQQHAPRRARGVPCGRWSGGGAQYRCATRVKLRADGRARGDRQAFKSREDALGRLAVVALTAKR
jgi:hypothetical protein